MSFQKMKSFCICSCCSTAVPHTSLKAHLLSKLCVLGLFLFPFMSALAPRHLWLSHAYLQNVDVSWLRLNDFLHPPQQCERSPSFWVLACDWLVNYGSNSLVEPGS
uniref:Uncharacterized protein n=1 Tax=Anguilla anguilla TaxID=7936 RepID=A0A0E9XNH9_ANGAN